MSIFTPDFLNGWSTSLSEPESLNMQIWECRNGDKIGENKNLVYCSFTVSKSILDSEEDGKITKNVIRFVEVSIVVNETHKDNSGLLVLETLNASCKVKRELTREQYNEIRYP